jgi:predicted dehydrogenase
MQPDHAISRREFVETTSKAVTSVVLLNHLPRTLTALPSGVKRRLAMIGTGHRGTGMWGKDVLRAYGSTVEFVGICDHNPGRLASAKNLMGVSCPTFADFEQMITKTKPDTVIVTTVDGTHHSFIKKALEMGCDVITEKPMTTSEEKLNVILEVQKTNPNNRIIMAHNYRYSPTRAKIKELLMQERIGRLTSVDFHWYLDVNHGADYFRRWHRLTEQSGTLLNHKASHHFDLLNWWIDSDPETVHAFGALEFYGKNHDFRHTHCRPCPFKDRCKFFFDMTKDERLMELYAKNESYDGYLRDGCVWKEDIDIYDKMAVQIRYMNNVHVSYSLTTYSPYEGYRIAFNGTRGRLDFWMHERQPWPLEKFDELQITDNFGKPEYIKLNRIEGDHYGGDPLMKEKIFNGSPATDPLQQAANVRDGAMSVLIGLAARKSIATGKAVQITDLTELVPQIKIPSDK